MPGQGALVAFRSKLASVDGSELGDLLPHLQFNTTTYSSYTVMDDCGY